MTRGTNVIKNTPLPAPPSGRLQTQICTCHIQRRAVRAAENAKTRRLNTERREKEERGGRERERELSSGKISLPRQRVEKGSGQKESAPEQLLVIAGQRINVVSGLLFLPPTTFSRQVCARRTFRNLSLNIAGQSPLRQSAKLLRSGRPSTCSLKYCKQRENRDDATLAEGPILRVTIVEMRTIDGSIP